LAPRAAGLGPPSASHSVCIEKLFDPTQRVVMRRCRL